MEPYVADADFTLYVGDALDVLRELPDGCVDCVVTSPPYWGLRDYGTGSWEGGEAGCDHKPQRGVFAEGCSACGGPMSEETEGCFKCSDRHRKRRDRSIPTDKDYRPFDPNRTISAQRDVTPAAPPSYRDVCGKCGATRVDRQLGLEPTPDQYVENIVAVFREVRRVLAAHGTCWVNLGDSYAGSWGAQGRDKAGVVTHALDCDMADECVCGVYSTAESSQHPNAEVPVRVAPDAATPDRGSSEGSSAFGISRRQIEAHPKKRSRTGSIPPGSGLKPKDLVGIPWRVAFALQADGWYLRSDIVWSKPNPMPESVTDRPTKAHEYVFLLAKGPRYFFDQEAVREPLSEVSVSQIAHFERNGEREDLRLRPLHGTGGGDVRLQKAGAGARGAAMNPSGRNIRSVWEMEQVGRPRGARHTLNDAYFANIATETQAYWLGFLYADGYVGRRHVDLMLSEDDADHVLLFREALGSSHKFTVRDRRARVVIASKRMADDLHALGMSEREEIPAISEDLVRHFVRGIFDGDGSAWKYLPAGRTKWRYGVSFLGTEGVLADIRVRVGLRGKPKLERGIHRLSVAAADDIARLYAYMYDGATVYLARKRLAFPQEQGVASSVWPIATQPYSEAHFATFPEALVERCLKAGCPEWVCSVCGTPRERIVEREVLNRVEGGRGLNGDRADGGKACNADRSFTTLGWSDCGHGNYRPGVVLDPFMGSGTTALVARRLGRKSIGIELSPEYAELCSRRLSQLSLLAEGSHG